MPLVVCDEVHKLSATFFGSEIRYTKRYRLGQLLSTLTRHFLLLTATPHNGKEEDFQLFMALLDSDRFEGRFRDGVHAAEVSDLMRRMVKERLLKLDGTPLFPERIAYTVPYRLSDPEAQAKIKGVAEDYGHNARPLFLPGDGPPERWIWMALQQYPQEYATALGLSAPDLERRIREIEQLTIRRERSGTDLSVQGSRYLQPNPVPAAI